MKLDANGHVIKAHPVAPGNVTAKRPAVIVISHETVWQSIVQDLFTAAMLIGVIGAGVYMQSNAMQYAGLGMLAIGCVCSLFKTKKYTIKEARDYLDEIEHARLGL